MNNFPAHCELIVLEKAPFDVILKDTLQAVWDEILSAISKFEYFAQWNAVDQRECCIYSKMRHFAKDQLIFNWNNPDPMTYLIVKGRCKLIEEVPVIQYVKPGLDKEPGFRSVSIWYSVL